MLGYLLPTAGKRLLFPLSPFPAGMPLGRSDKWNITVMATKPVATPIQPRISDRSLTGG